MTAAPFLAAGTDLLPVDTGVQVVTGFDRLRMHRGELESLAQRCHAGVTGRSTWMLGSAGNGPEPWAVLVRDYAGFLRAAAVLLDVANSSGTEIVTFAGSDLGHRGSLLADDRLWARRLGIALAHAMPTRARGWAVELGPLDADTPALAGFLAGFPQLVCLEVAPVPQIRRQEGMASVTDYLAPSMRRTLRKAHNRLAMDGRTFETAFSRSYTEICALLPSLARCHRNRDHDRGRESDLDDEGIRHTWQGRLADLALDGLLEVGTGYIDGAIASHVIGIRDGETYRVLEGHFVTEWGRYAPGRLLEAAVVQRMLDEPAIEALDWMTSIAPESLLAANAEAPMVVLRAGVGVRG
jgi:hypothetical protein